jgi:hypothetical protein
MTDVMEFIEKRQPTLSMTEMLLLDIARSMREQTKIAKEGLAFSQGLAHLFETQQ